MAFASSLPPSASLPYPAGSPTRWTAKTPGQTLLNCHQATLAAVRLPLLPLVDFPPHIASTRDAVSLARLRTRGSRVGRTRCIVDAVRSTGREHRQV